MIYEYPHTDFNEYNLDWVIKRIKDLTEEWTETKTEWTTMKADLEELKTFITSYFDNLDVQEEINNKIDEMVADGSLLALIKSTVETQSATTTASWLTEHITQPTTPVIDSSLTVAGAGADAKVTGDAIKNVNTALDSINDSFKRVNLKGWSAGGFYPTTGQPNYGFLDGTLYISRHFFTGQNGFTKVYSRVYEFLVFCWDVLTYEYQGFRKKDGSFSKVYAEQDSEYSASVNLPDCNKYYYKIQFRTISDHSAVIPENAYKDIYFLTTAYINDKYINTDYNTKEIGELNYETTSTVTVAETAYGPYIPVTHDFSGELISGIHLISSNTGIISLGLVKKTSFTTSDEYLETPISMIKLNAKMGINHLKFNPFYVPKGYSLCFGIPNEGNTLRFNYGGLQDTTQFWYKSGDKWASSKNLLNITVDVIKEQSVYNNKTISILGDSISTFTGYIPEGYPTYYPRADVLNVNSTWWKKVIDGLNMELLINNSYSGSRVTTTDGEESAGCMARCENLGENPDVIIVWMGINDFNNEVVLGSYDGTTAIPTDTTTFREAYAIMLNKILTKYMTSEIYVCTLPQCERNASTGFPEINGAGVPISEYNNAIKELANAFNVKVLEHDKCGLTYQNMTVYNPDQLHPNKKGHSLIANNDIKQLDGYIRKRYN